MGLISSISRSWKKSREAKQRSATQRVCRFEQLEPRIALSATPGPELDVGATYMEQSSPEGAGDRFEIAWVGGAANTQLTTLTISGDQDDNGFDDGDVFFDINSLPPGASDFAPFLVISPDSDITAAQITSATLANGGADLVLNITGWDAGETLVFTIDVDERDDVTNSQVEGAEFERATFTATFETSDDSYQPITEGGRVNGEFTDAYSLLPGLSGLLPADTGTQENDPSAGTSFGLHQTPNPIQISGRVHHDVDLDGDCDDPDPPVTDGSGDPIPVTLELWIKEGDTYVDTGERAVTDADGNFSFTYESAGTFEIREQQPSGYFSTTPDTISDIEVGPGQHSTDHCFGEALPGSLSGHVYEDNNDDGTIDVGESGIGSTTVTLRDSGGNLIGTTTTNAGGFYQFTNLDPMLTYTITETQPGSYIDGQDTLGSLGGNASVNDKFSLVSFTQSGQSGTDYDFGEIEPASLSGYVYQDLNDNDLKNGGEPGIGGVTLKLLDGSGNPVLDSGGNPITTTTNGSGFYQFTNLNPRLTYGVQEVQPAGYFDGQDQVGSAGGIEQNDKIITIDGLQAGVQALNYNFGELPPASLSGYVYQDLNDNDLKNGGEPGIGGVTLRLLDGSGNPVLDSGGNPITTTTNSSGFYHFDNLDPRLTYGVQEVQPAGYFDGQDQVGSAGGIEQNDKIITVDGLQPGVQALNYNFGELPPASLSGRVVLDGNCDGEIVGGEQGIGGVTVELLDGDGNPVLDGGGNPITTVTNSNGEWQFDNLDPRATYGVREVQPSAYADSVDLVGTAGGTLVEPDSIQRIDLAAGEEGANYIFAECHKPSISGFVFQDGPPIVLPEGVDPSTIDPMDYCNGRTPDDTPIAGVLLRLADGEGNFLRDGDGNFIETTTDANGFYEFEGLDPGTYTVFEFQPAGYIDGLESPGTTGGVVSHPGDSIAQITVDAGMHSEDNNFCELAVVTLPPPPPPPPPFTPPTPPETIIQTQPTQMGPGPGLAPPLAPPGGPASNIVFFGGGSPLTPAPGSTFHLSVIDAGRPRGEFQTAGFSSEAQMRAASTNLNVFSTDHAQLSEAQWVFASNPRQQPDVQYVFGSPDGIPVTGDFDGDGKTEVGIYRRGEWFIDVNGNGQWDEKDLWAKLGSETDLPVTGDWDGDGKTDIGIYGPEWASDPRAVMLEPGLPDRANEGPQGAKQNVPPPLDEAQPEKRQLQFTALGRRREDVIDHTFYYGTGTDIPVAGDWNGDGVWCIGVFNNGVWILDENGDGRGDASVTFGQAGDIPVVGDWTGDGIDKLGVYRQGTWILDTNNNRRIDEGDRTEHLGGPNDKPVVGDWDGDGKDEIGLYRRGGQVERGDGT